MNRNRYERWNQSSEKRGLARLGYWQPCLSPLFLLLVAWALAWVGGVAAEPAAGAAKMELAKPSDVRLHGVLGDAVELSRQHRLKTFIADETSKPIALFSEEARAKDTGGRDWYGEHAGKWLFTASRAAWRSGDADLRDNVRKVADYLLKRQGPDGYLGNYAPEARLTSSNPRMEGSWDVWTNSYMLVGLLELYKNSQDRRYLDAAVKIGDLFVKTFGEGGKDIAYWGNHVGLSSVIAIEPVMELYRATGDRRYLDLAERFVKQMDARPGLQPMMGALKGNDASAIGDGKVYQLLWTWVGLAKLYGATGNEDELRAIRNGWQNVVSSHLTLAGGPWGGIGGHPEQFNRQNFFSPFGYVETCSTMAWIHLNRELLSLTGEAKYAEELEKTVYNSLLAAQWPNGEDWCYFIFPNGKWHKAAPMDCCKSSGALALEEVGPLFYGVRRDGAAVNLYGPSEGAVTLPEAGTVHLVQRTGYPFDGEVTIGVQPEKNARFALLLRKPAWASAQDVSIKIGAAQEVSGTVGEDGYYRIEREWKKGDEVTARFPMKARLATAAQAVAHRKTPVFKSSYVALLVGPLLYAASHEGESDAMPPLTLPQHGAEALFAPCAKPSGVQGPAWQLTSPDAKPLVFTPYFETCRNDPAAWRLSWLPVEWK